MARRRLALVAKSAPVGFVAQTVSYRITHTASHTTIGAIINRRSYPPTLASWLRKMTKCETARFI
jgi:hypothetical protein